MRIAITARLMVSADPPTPQADAFARRYMAAYLNVPVYKAFHEWLGRSAVLGPMWQAWDTGDRRGALAAIPEQTIHDLIVRGSAQEMRTQVGSYLDGGVDTVFLHLFTCESEPARQSRIGSGLEQTLGILSQLLTAAETETHLILLPLKVRRRP
jgi:alkanesulfonate monooxygenase SsuD/methylene tetrahydromethanopterin reductase-like flavin-dependent oxidoreductase (luciferase family)